MRHRLFFASFLVLCACGSSSGSSSSGASTSTSSTGSSGSSGMVTITCDLRAQKGVCVADLVGQGQDEQAYSQDCTMQGGTLVSSCPKDQELGCCYGSISLETRCYYPSSGKTAASAKSDCEMSSMPSTWMNP